jgi:hypothetical protein
VGGNRSKGTHRRVPEVPGFEVTAQMALVRRRGRTLDCSTRPGRNSSCTGSSRNRPTRVRMEASVKGARSRWVLRGRPKPPRRLDKLGPSHGSHLGVKGIEIRSPPRRTTSAHREVPTPCSTPWSVIGPSAPFTRLLSKNAPANTTPLLVGDFLRVDHPLRPAKSLKGLCRMTNPCGVSHGQMAKVEL